MAPRAHMILVGVDDSAPARQAIRWALAQARATGATVRLMHVWQEPLSWLEDPHIAHPAMGPLVRQPFDPEQAEPEWAEGVRQKLGALQTAAEQEVERALADAGGAHGDVPVQVGAAGGDMREVLVDASADAELLVLGSHRTQALAAAVLGSVSHHCALHAHCPVVIIPTGVTLAADGRLNPDGSPPS